MSDRLSPKTEKILKRRGHSIATFRACVLVLRDQIESARLLLKPKDSKCYDDATHIHALRVACRRAQSLVLFFESAGPGSLLDPISKRLRKIRRATNEVRELDVLIENLNHWPMVPNRVRLLRILRKQRKDAGARMRDELKPVIKSKKLGKLAKRLSLSANTNSEFADEPSSFLQTPFRDFAINSLRFKLDDYLSRRPNTWSDLDAIHRYRILGKHVRYDLELVSIVYSKKAVCKVVEQFIDIQTELGNVHDMAQGVSMIQSQLESANDITLAAAWQTVFDRQRRRLSKMQRQLPNHLSEERFGSLHQHLRQLFARN
ncbi:MAG: CHAD domain-containing protein [Planctomycetes bacterium]|nr:CHAD domain-containing protein [Planctomycetota bacterium]